MIDTIKLQINVSEVDYQKLYAVSDRLELYKGNTQIIKSSRHSLSVNIPSWDRHLTVLLPQTDTNYIYIEFNVSKAYYGHNFFRVNLEQTGEVLSSLNYYFKNLYDVDLGNYLTWRVLRVDPCLSYRFDPDTELSIIESVKGLNPIDLKTKKYDTGAEFFRKSKNYKLMFYDKGAEFITHKELSKYYLNGAVERGNLLKEFSKGILIYEIQLRERGFYKFFGKSTLTVKELLNFVDIRRRLIKELKNFIIRSSYMKLTSVIQLIEKQDFSNEVKTNLLKDFLFMTDTTPAVRRLWKSQSRQYRSQVKLRLKKIGIPQDVKNDDRISSLLSLSSPYYLGSPTREQADVLMNNAVYPTVKPTF